MRGSPLLPREKRGENVLWDKPVEKGNKRTAGKRPHRLLLLAEGTLVYISADDNRVGGLLHLACGDSVLRHDQCIVMEVARSFTFKKGQTFSNEKRPFQFFCGSANETEELESLLLKFVFPDIARGAPNEVGGTKYGNVMQELVHTEIQHVVCLRFLCLAIELPLKHFLRENEHKTTFCLDDISICGMLLRIHESVLERLQLAAMCPFLSAQQVVAVCKAVDDLASCHRWYDAFMEISAKLVKFKEREDVKRFFKAIENSLTSRSLNVAFPYPRAVESLERLCVVIGGRLGHCELLLQQLRREIDDGDSLRLLDVSLQVLTPTTERPN